MGLCVGIGIDIVDIERMRAARDLPRVMEFFLTPAELAEASRFPDAAQFAASRFAAKEAVIKAFPKRLKPHDFEIRRSGKKLTVRFLRPAYNRYTVLVSIAHVPQFAVASASVRSS